MQADKIFVRLEEGVLRHFDVLDTSKLQDAPDGEAAYALYGNMRQAVRAFLWGVVLKDVFWRNADSGEARHVRFIVDVPKEYGFCLRHPCVDFDWAPDPDAPIPEAQVTSNHPGVWRRGRRTHHDGAYAAGDDQGLSWIHL